VHNDLSDLSLYSFEIASRIATQCSAKIIVVGVVPAPLNAKFDTKGDIKMGEGLDYTDLAVAKNELQQKLEKWAKQHSIVEEVIVKVGHFENVVVRYANEYDVDMIALGIPDMHGVGGNLIDSNAQRLVRSAPMPVLTLKCDRSGYELTDLLLVSDFSKPEKLNLGLIHELVNCMNLTVHLLTVSTPKHFVTTLEGKAQMERFAALNQLEHVKLHVYSDRSVEKGIADFSVETGIDFVAIGTHQRTGVSRVLKGGSIAEDVVNHLYQPILTFQL